MPTAVARPMIPFVHERFDPRTRLGDYARREGRDTADAMRRSGDLSAQMWSGIGGAVSGTLRDIAAYPEQQRARQRDDLKLQREEQAYQTAEQAKQADAAKAQRLQQLVKEHGGRVPSDRLLQEFGAEDAADISKAFDSVFPKPKEEEAYTLNPGDVRFKGNQQIASVPKPEPPQRPVAPGSIEQQIADALGKGDQATVIRLTKAASLAAGARRAPEKAGPGDGGQRKRMVDAVMGNPSLWDDLTPTVKGDLAADLASAGFNGFGKRLSDGTIKQLSESKAAIQSLRDLRTTLQENEQYIGPVAGLQALNPYSDAKKAEAKINLVRQRVGKALEGGVLRKEDEEKYKTILSTLRDEPTTAIYKVDNLIETLENDLATFADEQRSAGRRMPAKAESSGDAGGVSVKTPDGQTFTFPNKAQADAFRKRAGIK